MEEIVQNIIKFNNYTRMPNETIEALLELNTVSEIKSMLLILRKTYGWNKSEDRISLSQFKNETHLSKTSVTNAIKNLISKGLIEKVVSAGGSIFRPLLVQTLHQGGPIVGHTKDNSQKTKKKTTTGSSNRSIKRKSNSLMDPIKHVVANNLKMERIEQATPDKSSQIIKSIISKICAHGVSKKVAKDLVVKNPLKKIEEQLAYIDHRNCDDKAAVLVASIKCGFGAPRSAKQKISQAIQIESKVKNKSAQIDAIERARQSTHIKTASGRLMEIKNVHENGNVEFYMPGISGEDKLEQRPIHILMMNKGLEFIKS